jgi:hypothetical protein
MQQQQSAERRTMDDGVRWPATELRSITARLQELRQRLAELVDELRVVETAGAAGAQASEAITEVQRRAWVVATDLVGAVRRLELLARGLRRPTPRDGSAGLSREVAELLRATIECVLVDHLDPAIQALMERWPPMDDEESCG